MVDTVDAYVFMHAFEGRPSGVLGSMIEAPGVRFAARFVGSFVGFGAVEAPDIATLQSRIDGEYWDAGARSDWSLVVKASALAIPKRRSPEFCAIIRARAAGSVDPEELLDELDDHFGGTWEDVGYGAAVVTGPIFDLLVELGADSLSELWDHVRELRQITGIGRTATAVAYLPDNALRS